MTTSQQSIEVDEPLTCMYCEKPMKGECQLCDTCIALDKQGAMRCQWMGDACKEDAHWIQPRGEALCYKHQEVADFLL